MRRALLSTLGLGLVAALMLLDPPTALACPSCAGREDGGLVKLAFIGSMILFPFAVTWTVWKVVRSAATGNALPGTGIQGTDS